MVVAAAVSTGEEAIEDVRRYRPDVLTLDLLLPDIPGAKLARRILAELPRTWIVAITSTQGSVHMGRALDAGVHGYLSKALTLCELVRAIRHVRAGEGIIPGPVSCETAEHIDCPLTRREIEVLHLAAWANGNQQIAAQLSIARETARMHTKHILVKLGAHDRAHTVTIAVVRGMLRLWNWTVLDAGTTKSDLEGALLPIDLFPRAAVLLLVFERVPLKDAAILLDSKVDLVKNAMAAGVHDLTINLAKMQGWKTASTSETQHA